MNRPKSPLPGPPVAIGGWLLWEAGLLDSTNDAASALPAWNAVRADRQRAGRGRHDRTWVSDAGGLWLSAVVPTGPAEQGWAALPLAAGLTVGEVLRELGMSPLRLRWPNDVMTGPRKLAGILVDQYQSGLAVVGIGINVTNRPETVDPDLDGEVARLEEHVDAPPDLRALSGRLLRRLRSVCEEMRAGGFARIVSRVNDGWPAELPVTLETDSARFEGVFAGVDPAGRLRLRTSDGSEHCFGAHQVVRLREGPASDGGWGPPRLRVAAERRSTTGSPRRSAEPIRKPAPVTGASLGCHSSSGGPTPNRDSSLD